jgi:hypothetical protein
MQILILLNKTYLNRRISPLTTKHSRESTTNMILVLPLPPRPSGKKWKIFSRK